MKKIINGEFYGERSLYNLKEAYLENVNFLFGESPLKETSNIALKNVTFKWKYPLWYAKHISCTNVRIEEMGRSGIWYTDDISFKDSLILAPKLFRRASNITLFNTDLPNALETFWNCNNISLNKVYAKGDYFCFNSSNIMIENFTLDGNYAFDGGKNIIIKNAVLNSKDSFWNCDNVTIYDSKIVGEYLGWNSTNITLINCEISSNQGLCYMDNVKLVNCKLTDTDLAFEFSKSIDAEIVDEFTSIKNPISGKISAKGVKKIILDEKFVDKEKTIIEVK